MEQLRVPKVDNMAESAVVCDSDVGGDGVSRCCCGGSGSSRCSDFASKKFTSPSPPTFQRWRSLPQSFIILLLSLVLFLEYSHAFPDPDRHLKEMYHKSVVSTCWLEVNPGTKQPCSTLSA